MDAPEKIYVHVKKDKTTNTWNSTCKGVRDVEYIRKDAFIEKANKWLSFNIKMLMNVLDVEYNTHDTDIKDFIEDFRMYMK